jgi:hypothetical protein
MQSHKIVSTHTLCQDLLTSFYKLVMLLFEFINLSAHEISGTNDAVDRLYRLPPNILHEVINYLRPSDMLAF